MMEMPPHAEQPQIAVIATDTLSCIGLKHLLKSMMPKAIVRTFLSFKEFSKNQPDSYFHYFISTEILLNNANYFSTSRLHKTIVLVHGNEGGRFSDTFHTLDICLPEEYLIKSFLRLEQSAHGANKPQAHIIKKVQSTTNNAYLTPREQEVLKLLVKGFINKEIADQLNVSITTIISHRKNITEKLQTRSISALTIYAVMHGFVRIEDI